MPLFRFHRGGLDESLQTTCIVKDIKDLINIIKNDWREWPTSNINFKIEIEAYPSTGACFDKRIGWFTHIVTADIVEIGKMHPIGFLSEPFND